MTDLRDDAADTTLHGGGLPVHRWEAMQDQVRKRKLMETAMGGPAMAVPTIDRFELREHLGSGGMGAVFKAFDPQLRRLVAIKICKVEDDDSASAIEHEARCLAQVAHPNVVGAYEVVRTESCVLLVMEFVKGQTLRTWQRETQPSWAEVLAHCLDAGHGLEAVHAAGLEHGDFKPENVLVGDDGRVRVADFGIARHLAGPVTDDDIEPTAMGTIPYMAPERLTGRPSDERADVYSYCVTVWESLYGTRPYEGTTPSKLLDSMELGTLATDPDRALKGTPAAIRPILAAGVSPRAEDRPPSMTPLLRALTDIPELEQRRVARRRVTGALVLGMFAVMVYRVIGRQEVQVEHEPQPAIEIANAEREVVDPEPSIERAMSLAARADPFGARAEFERVDEQGAVDVGTTLRLACILVDRARTLPGEHRKTTLHVADQVASTAESKAEWVGTNAQVRAAHSLLEAIRASR